MRKPIATLVTSASIVVGCGDPLITSETRGDPIFTIGGTVSQGLSTPPGTAQEVGVLWLNRNEGDITVRVETTPADTIGATLPAEFDVSIVTPPSDRMLGTTPISYTDDGQSARAIDRNRVAFGLVVVAPEGTLASLPDTVALNDIVGTGAPGSLLQRFTYVSPYTVRYVKGAEADALTLRDADGNVSPLKDLTAFDIADWADAIAVVACREKAGGSVDDAEIAECAAKEAEKNPDRDRTEIVNGCAQAIKDARAATLDDTCGAAPDSSSVDFRNIRRLDPTERMNLPLGVDDIREALISGGYVFID